MIRILVADASGQHYQTLRSMLDQEEDFYLVGCAHTLEELNYLLPLSNLVFITSDLDDITISDLITTIYENDPQIKMLVYGIAENPNAIVQAIEMGADGYILAHESPEQLIAKTRATIADKAVVSPKVAAQIVKRISDLANQIPLVDDAVVSANRLDLLTPRELEVLKLIAQGLTNKAIAQELIISTGTVKNHVHKILKKVEVSNRHEAANVYTTINE